ncbi:hypothetical protein IIB79_11120, partial [candidate division KSB1 bacterium]|nr:hypothetical protein [candidate division KSB1 bacterium]
EIRNRILDQGKERIRALEELAVYPAVYNIMSDNETVFVFTFEYDKEKGRLVDIFDGIKGEYIRSAYFPAWVANPTARDRSFLRNGYVYRLLTPPNDFAVVEKYKIDPKVYGK